MFIGSWILLLLNSSSVVYVAIETAWSGIHISTYMWHIAAGAKHSIHIKSHNGITTSYGHCRPADRHSLRVVAVISRE